LATYVHSQEAELSAAGETLRNALRGDPATLKKAV
jgi:hypothetical protein